MSVSAADKLLDDEINAAFRGYVAEERRRAALYARPAARLDADDAPPCTCHVAEGGGRGACERVRWRLDADGKERANVEPCNPVNGDPNMTTMRTDTTDEATQIASIENARKARDQRAHEAGRFDAKDARVREIRNALRASLDPTIKDRDVRDLIAMHNGDPTGLDVALGATFRDLTLLRAHRAERERHASVMSAAMPPTTGGANLDADDGGAPIVIPADDPIATARADRDARMAALGR